MKNTILLVLIVACAALGAFCFVQEGKLQKQAAELVETKQQLADLQTQLAEKNEALDAAKSATAKADILQKTLNESTTVAVEQSKKAEELRQSLAEAKTNSPLHGIAAMFKDPKMREMMKAQQKAVIGPMIAKQYGDLFKQLNLTDDQQAAVKDLLQKRMLAGADAGLSMIDDSVDASQKADLAKQIKDQREEADNEIKQALGDQNYQAFQAYEKTVPDRTTVNQFNDQFAGTGNALNADQQTQLIQAMSDARNNFNWTSGLNQQNQGANADMASLLTDDNIQKFTQEREQFDDQFLARAQQILTQQQLQTFKDFQATQRQMQITAMKMAGQMFKH
jgi:hypothetical protein